MMILERLSCPYIEKHLSFLTAMPELLHSAKLAVEKGLAQGRNESYVKQLSDYIIPALVEALHKVVLDHVSICFFPLPASVSFFFDKFLHLFLLIFNF